jgi:hypothetical protein
LNARLEVCPLLFILHVSTSTSPNATASVMNLFLSGT